MNIRLERKKEWLVVGCKINMNEELLGVGKWERMGLVIVYEEWEVAPPR